MKLAAAVIIAGTLLSIGFCMETSRKETAKQLQELIRFLLFAGQEIEIRGSILEDVFTKASSITQGADKRTSKQDGETYGRRRRFFAGVEPCRKRSI